jgi:hypothetical protein
MKRQRGRNRGGGGNTSGKPQQQNANRAFDSNGPEGVKVRGNAQHVFEKYQQLARDASSGGDRVLAENYLQHAEHYFRLLRAMQPNRPASEFLTRDQFSSGFDIDFEDETAQAQAQAADEAAAEGGQAPQTANEAESWQGDRPREDRQREERPREDRPRDDRPRNFDNQNGQQRSRWRDERGERTDRNFDRPREDRPREDRPREERQQRDDRPRDDQRPRDEQRPREERPRDEQRPREERQPREDRPQREDRAPREDRFREERVQAEEPRGAVLRDSDGGESHAPAFLSAAPAPRPETTAEEPVRRPRRVRKPAPDRDTEEA